MAGRENKRGHEEFQMKRGNNIYKRTALGRQRAESKVEDQCPYFQAINDEIRRLGNEYLSDIKSHLEYYTNVQRASIHLTKVAGLSAGQKLSFDIENIPILIMVFATTYGKLGMNLSSFEAAVELAQKMLSEMAANGEPKDLE